VQEEEKAPLGQRGQEVQEEEKGLGAKAMTWQTWTRKKADGTIWTSGPPVPDALATGTTPIGWKLAAL
jgi:hypothetical protein